MWDVISIKGSALGAVKCGLDSRRFYAWNASKRTKAGMGVGWGGALKN